MSDLKRSRQVEELARIAARGIALVVGVASLISAISIGGNFAELLRSGPEPTLIPVTPFSGVANPTLAAETLATIAASDIPGISSTATALLESAQSGDKAPADSTVTAAPDAQVSNNPGVPIVIVQQPAEEEEHKWWIEKVVVPLLVALIGTGAVTAIFFAALKRTSSSPQEQTKLTDAAPGSGT